jgi:hypothetical protein
MSVSTSFRLYKSEEEYSPQPPGILVCNEAAEFKTVTVFCAEYEPVAYAVEPFIGSSSLYTLTARTGAGKTALLIILALAIATGRGELLGCMVEKGRVAYIVAENPDNFRMRLIVTAYLYNVDLNAIANDLVILDKRMKPEELAAKLKMLAANGKFSLIIGDTLQALYDGDDFNNNAQAGDYIRRWRPLTEIEGRPAVVIAAHPVKNAAADNLIPYGGGAILNEVDGNLTLNKSAGGVTALHWQGKLRGIEFEPLKFRFEELSSPDVKDAKGREVKLPVFRPITDADAEQRAKVEVDRDTAILRAMATNPDDSLDDWSVATGIPKTTIKRRLDHLQTPKFGKLVEKLVGKWSLTTAGKKAVRDGE